MSKKKTRRSRSEVEDREHLRGIIRKKDKRIRLLEREVSRLTKYLMRVDFDVVYDEDEPRIKAPPREPDWTCKECGGHECDELILPQRNLIRKYTTCRDCGNKTRETIDDKTVAAERE